MTVETTARDRAWLVVINALLNNEDLQTSDITEEADVSADTARAVLGVAESEEVGLFYRDSPRAQTWHSAVAPVVTLDDYSMQESAMPLLRQILDEAIENVEANKKVRQPEHDPEDGNQ